PPVRIEDEEEATRVEGPRFAEVRADQAGARDPTSQESPPDETGAPAADSGYDDATAIVRYQSNIGEVSRDEKGRRPDRTSGVYPTSNSRPSSLYEERRAKDDARPFSRPQPAAEEPPPPPKRRDSVAARMEQRRAESGTPVSTQPARRWELRSGEEPVAR